MKKFHDVSNRQRVMRLRAALKIALAYRRYVVRTYFNLVYGTFKYSFLVFKHFFLKSMLPLVIASI